jgi:apolipoprotein N-acyltransferase
MVNYLLVVFAGLITPFAFAPFGYIPTIFIGHLILFWLIFNSKDNKQAFKIGLVFGLSEYLLGFYWMFSIKLYKSKISKESLLAYQGKPVNSHDFIHSYSIKIDGVNKA